MSNDTKWGASALAIAVSMWGFAPAVAQEDADTSSTDGLERIVVTASGGQRSQLESSVSATRVDEDVIQDFQPSSDSELFRLLPGIQVAGTVGPGGNSNIAVRGLPVATGGAPFVQIQEDGLPQVLFGDIQFGNNDYWTKFDATTAGVEAVRGGTVSTFASQAPGAVINYISHTGEEEGGYIQLQAGLGFDETRVDFRYGMPINDTLRFHVGGFFKRGEGPLDAGFNTSDSVQIKANITKEFDDGNGFFRLLVKFADTQEPNYAGAPALATLSGSEVSDIEPFPGFDGRDELNQSNQLQRMLILNREGNLENVRLDGITTNQKTIGGHFSYNLSDAISVENKMRWSDIDGAFASQFLGVARTDSVIGSELTLNGVPYATVAEIRFASGPNAGELYTNTYLDNNAMFRTNIRDLGSFVNDLLITGDYDVGFGVLTAQLGYFYMSQDIAADWQVNRNNRELSGDNAAPLDLFDDAGNQLTRQGISGYNNNWGECCARDYDLNYTDQAPYFALSLDTDWFVIDGSVRYDRIKATGNTLGSDGVEFFVDSNGIDIPAIAANTPLEVLDYTEDYVSWTVGALYKFSDDTSFFARAAKGNRFNADRQTFSGKINPDGSLNQAGLVAAVDVVRQYELGAKHRGDLGFGFYTVELTLLKGEFTQSTFEINPNVCGSAGTCIIDAEFETQGVEFYGTFGTGDFFLIANATYTDAERKLSGARDFERSPNIPDLTYTVAANYDIIEMLTVGLSLTGQTSHVNNAQIEFPSTALFNGVIKFRPIENLEFGIDAYNIFDEYEIRTEGNIADGSVNPVVLNGPTALGRTVRASVRYAF